MKKETKLKVDHFCELVDKLTGETTKKKTTIVESSILIAILAGLWKWILKLLHWT